MKLHKTLGLATAGIVWLTTPLLAQSPVTSPNTAPSTVRSPMLSPDTLRPSREQMINDNTAGQEVSNTKTRRDRRRLLRRNKQSAENARQNRAGSTAPEADPTYRRGPIANGTVINNSNVTNHNSSNASTPPTGVGSLPAEAGANGEGQATTTATPDSKKPDMAGQTATPNLKKPAATGTGEAVSGAENAPLVKPPLSNPSISVGDFVASQPDYTTLQNALQSADLIEALKEGQAYTLFAPSNAAFRKLPATVQNVMLDGQNRAALKALLTYHVVKGTLDGKELSRQIKSGNGTARLKTMAGGLLMVSLASDGRLLLKDEQGTQALIDTPDRFQTNGVVHGIEAVLMPQKGAIIFR